jgi:hypothetical protein
MQVVNFSGGSSRLLILLLEVLISFAILTQLFVDMLRISTMLYFVLLDECVNKIIKVVVETPDFVLHILLERDASHLDFVDETSENCGSIILLIAIEN